MARCYARRTAEQAIDHGEATLDPNGLNLAGPRVVTIARPARSICATISPDCPFNVSGMTKAD